MPQSRIQAVVIDSPGVLRHTQLQLDDPGPGEVEVRIVAAGVCGSDLHVYRGDWSVRYPMVMGHEGSGYVSRIGYGVDHLDIGDPVVLSWNPPCRQCRACLAGRPFACERARDLLDKNGVLFDGSARFSESGNTVYHYLGISSWAEAVVVPATGAIRVPTTANLTQAALVGCALPTGIGAVRNTAQLAQGARVLVIGCGGVGLSCIQGARLCGASHIVAMDVDRSRLEVASKLGATSVVPVSTSEPADAVLASRHRDGFDAVFDAVGSIATLAMGLRLLALAGSLVIVGLAPEGTLLNVDPLELAMRNQRILGSNYGSIDPQVDISRIVAEIAEGAIQVAPLISNTRPLAQAFDALEDLANGRVIRQLLIP